eukprot:964175-Pyramimonas_sp.AAC.1
MSEVYNPVAGGGGGGLRRAPARVPRRQWPQDQVHGAHRAAHSVRGLCASTDCGVLVMKDRHENIPTHPASDWSAMRIYPRILRLIGRPCEYTHASCVRLVPMAACWYPPAVPARAFRVASGRMPHF